jgi:hypothetical protein
MQAQGLTKEMATQWRSFYVTDFARNTTNVIAWNRAKLMDTIIGMMK